MKNLGILCAAAALLLTPMAATAQDANEEPQTGIVTMSTIKVPMGEERGKVMEWIEKAVAPMARVNPNIMAFYVLEHYYGSDSRDVVFVRVYKDLASIEAECGEPCQAYMDANFPAEDSPEREEWSELWRTFMKYNGRHSDEIYSARLDIAKN
jgi:hypothetical protein